MHSSGIVSAILPFHIAGGMLALVFGYIALYAMKGASVHRKSGLLFVAAMVVMSLSGAFIATLNGSTVSIVAGLLTFYFVATALLTVRRGAGSQTWFDSVAIVYILVVSGLAFIIAFQLSQRGRPEAPPMFLFGIVGLLAAVGDLRMVRAQGIHGRQRIVRHLWRMCFAMWIAAASFFWGPRGRVPEVIRIPALLPIPVLLPIVVMLVWLWRLRTRASARAMARLSDAQAA